MELGGPIPHSQGLSNNPYPDPNKKNPFQSSLTMTSPGGLFSVVLSVNILNSVLPYQISREKFEPEPGLELGPPDL